MIDLNKTMSYKQYIEGYNSEEVSKQVEKYEQTVLSEEGVKKIKDLNHKVNVVVFTEGYCPDCHVTIPFVTKMADLNNNINVRFMNRTGNEQLLTDFTGEARIPTLMFFSESMEPKGVYIEFPEALKEQMAGKRMEEVKAMVNEYRQGKYNELIESEIVNILSK